jgi:hypothetical protein
VTLELLYLICFCTIFVGVDFMRKNNINEEAFTLLKENKTDQAEDLFNQQCDMLNQCISSDNTNKCISLCLIPKLTYMEICGGGDGVKTIIKSIKRNKKRRL